MDRLEALKDGTTDRVWFYPQEGRPTATPSVGTHDQYGTALSAAADTNVTLDAVNTTLSANASAGDESVTLTATTNVEVGVEYLLTSTLGQVERVRVASVDHAGSGVAGLYEPLEYAHASTSTFVGTRFYYELQTADVNALAELNRARATYAVGGINHTLEEPYDVCLLPLSNRLTAAYLKANRPSITAQEHKETRGTDFTDLREQAWDRVKKGIRALGDGDDHRWRPALVRVPSNLDLWALAEFELMAHKNHVDVLPPGDWSGESGVQYLEEQRNKERAKVLNGGFEWLDLNEDDSRGEGEERRLELTYRR